MTRLEFLLSGQPAIIVNFGGDSGASAAAAAALALSERLDERGVWITGPRADGGSDALRVPQGSAIRLVFDGEVPELIRDNAFNLDQASLSELLGGAEVTVEA